MDCLYLQKVIVRGMGGGLDSLQQKADGEKEAIFDVPGLKGMLTETKRPSKLTAVKSPVGKRGNRGGT